MKTASLALILVLLTGVASAQSVELEFRVYDVSAITESRHHTYASRLGHQGSLSYFEEMEEQDPRQFLSVDALADYVRATVEPGSWEGGGDVMGMRGRLLLVKNRPAVHQKIQEFLRGLSAGASQRIGFSVEVYELGDEQYAALAPDAVPEPGPAKVDRNVNLVDSASGEAWPGITTAVQVTNRMRYVGDYDAEIAQGSNISDPVVSFGVEGTSVELIVRPTVNGDRLVIDAIVQYGRFDRPFRQLELGVDEENMQGPYRSTVRKNLGIIELPVFRMFGAAMTRIVPATGTFTIPVVAEGRTLIVKVRTKLLGSKVPESILTIGALCHRPELVYFGVNPEVEADEADIIAPTLLRFGHELPPFFPGPEELLDLILQNVAPWYWEEGEARVNITENHDLVVLASEDILKAVRKFVVDLETQQLRQIHFDVRVLSSKSAIAPGVRDSFPEGVPIYAGKVSTLPDRRASFQIGNTMNYIADYDVEVAQEARISDPIIGQSFEGLVANLQPTLTTDGEQVVTKLKLLLSSRELGKVFDSGARFLGPIDRLSENRREFDTTVTIPAGSVYILDAGMNPVRKGEHLVVAIKASTR